MIIHTLMSETSLHITHMYYSNDKHPWILKSPEIYIRLTTRIISDFIEYKSCFHHYLTGYIVSIPNIQRHLTTV